MVTLTKAVRTDGVLAKGEWKATKLGTGELSAVVCCPGCGKIAGLGDHVVDTTGKVIPSLVCPFDCGFHDYVHLEGWVEHD